MFWFCLSLSSSSESFRVASCSVFWKEYVLIFDDIQLWFMVRPNCRHEAAWNTTDGINIPFRWQLGYQVIKVDCIPTRTMCSQAVDRDGLLHESIVTEPISGRYSPNAKKIMAMWQVASINLRLFARIRAIWSPWWTSRPTTHLATPTLTTLVNAI